jgi:hypothetical protein
MSALARRFRQRAELPQVLDQLGAIHTRLARSTTPRTAVHGDFWNGNLLTNERAITGVVDWESGRRRSEPLRDVVRFGLSYSLYLDRHTRPGHQVAGHGFVAGEWGQGVRYALDGKGWYPELVRGFLQSALVRLGAAPEHWRDAALAGLAEIAASADEFVFAERHLNLFQRLTRGADAE